VAVVHLIISMEQQVVQVVQVAVVQVQVYLQA
jgi:hypothetical protein